MGADPAIAQAMRDGVLAGVSAAVANCFSVYRQQRSDRQQHHRTQDGLIEIILAAEDLMTMIAELEQQENRLEQGHNALK